MTQVFIEPEDLADFHQQIMKERSAAMHLVAKDDEYESSIYLSDDNGMPVLTAMLHGVEVENLDYFEDSDDLEGKAARMYAVYVGSTNPDYKIVSAGSDDGVEYDDDNIIEDDADYSDEELRELFGKDEEDTGIEANEEEFNLLLEQVFEFLVDGEELSEAIDSGQYNSWLEDVKDGMCWALADLGLMVRRPTILKNSDGSRYIEEYPYN